VDYMAKKITQTTSKKKIQTKKASPKRRSKKSKYASLMKKNILIVLGVFLLITMVLFGYFLGQSNRVDSSQKTNAGKMDKATQSIYTTQELLEDLSHIQVKKLYTNLEDEVKKEVSKALQVKMDKVTQAIYTMQEASDDLSLSKAKESHSDVESEVKKELSKAIELHIQKKSADTLHAEDKSQKDDDVIKTIQKEPLLSFASHTKKPKLVIIIDDISSKSQIRRIRALDMKLTPSIFPPSEISMSSHKLAQGLKHYMIHLPMQSGSKRFNSQHKTLMLTDSTQKIEARVAEIRSLFPTARYINSHTGSVFTDNYEAMDILYKALRKQGFIFVDSLTTASSKVGKIAHHYGDRYISRDIFIDNQLNLSSIRRQLKKAVNVAKRKGYAIAIGHPHKVTMRALGAADDILSEVNLVYIDELFRRKR